MTTRIISSDGVASTPTPSGPRLARGSVGPAVLALAGVVGTWLVATGVTGGLVVDQGSGPEEVGVLAAVGATICGVGIGLAFLARRFSARPRRTFLAVCAVALAAYGVVPFLVAESAAVAIWLNVLHLVVAVPVVGGLARLPALGEADPDPVIG